MPLLIANHGEVQLHLTLVDLVAVSFIGTLGTGIFVFSPLVASSYAGPSSILCWFS